MIGGIFISYRRDDAKHAAGRLVDRLGRSFSRDQLFFDIDNIEPGLDFKKVLSEKVEGCDVLLAVMGPEWLNSRDQDGMRRLDNPLDFVRLEIEAALSRDVRVIPVLVDGARMPRENELPEAMRPLIYRNAVRLSHERFASDAGDLTEALLRIASAANARVSNPSVAIPPPIPATPSADSRWENLVRYDPDIGAAVNRLAVYGPSAVERLRNIYSDIQDKAALPSIVSDIEVEFDPGNSPNAIPLGFQQVAERAGVPIYSNGKTFHVDGNSFNLLENAKAYALFVSRRTKT